MNELQMHAYRVYCNKSLIASFHTEREAKSFAQERSERWPNNDYHLRHISDGFLPF